MIKGAFLKKYWTNPHSGTPQIAFGQQEQLF